ncbi:MAG: small multi-drug export protein [Treponema sp.]|jgi:uncharacterized membrane protein|nr:small multi-drug export protein [Treponema sp.]
MTSDPLSYLWTAFLSLLPVSELRGGIPFAIVAGIPWYIAWPFAVLFNSLAAPLCWLFLSTLHRLFYDGAKGQGGFGWYRRFFDRVVERAREKLHSGVEKWGALGIALFVAVPLPMTGAWTGTIGAWVLGLPKRKTLPAVILGVCIAGAVVTAVMTLGIGALHIFMKAS